MEAQLAEESSSPCNVHKNTQAAYSGTLYMHNKRLLRNSGPINDKCEK